MPLPVEIKEVFLLTLYGDKTELEFETWLYQDNQLAKLLEKHIEKDEIEKGRILRLLSKALKRDIDLPDILVQFYDLYCAGYTFLDTLRLEYGLAVAVPYDYDLSWDSITKEEQTKIIQGFYPHLKIEIHKVMNWLNEDQIVLTGVQDENGFYEFLDNRKIEAETIVKPAAVKKLKRWWKFW